MDIPAEISDSVFDQTPIKKGAIIKTEYRFPNGRERQKFFIILNKHPQEDPLVCVITTSQIDFYIKNPKFNNDTLTIAANSISCFNKDTVVDCRQIYALTKNSVKVAFSKNTLTFAGELPDHLIEKIDDIIKTSLVISTTDKKKILGA